MNSITDLLDLEDANISISSIDIEGQTKTIYLETAPEAHFCPCCGFRMHSRGTKNRKINHPILQDGYQLILYVTQRKWKCTNHQCNLYFNDQFNFISKYKQSSNITPYMILNEMKNIHITTADAAKKYNISDTSVHYIFLQYLDIKRLPLPEILSVSGGLMNTIRIFFL